MEFIESFGFAMPDGRRVGRSDPEFQAKFPITAELLDGIDNSAEAIEALAKAVLRLEFRQLE